MLAVLAMTFGIGLAVAPSASAAASCSSYQEIYSPVLNNVSIKVGAVRLCSIHNGQSVQGYYDYRADYAMGVRSVTFTYFSRGQSFYQTTTSINMNGPADSYLKTLRLPAGSNFQIRMTLGFDNFFSPTVQL